MATRRGFIGAFLSLVAALVARPFMGARASETHEHARQVADAATDTVDAYTGATEKVAVPLDDAAELKRVGGSVTVEVADRRILLVRDSDESVRAFAPACTHRQVKVKYDHKNRRLNCSAHGSRFDLDGKVLRGPAKESLPTCEATLAGDRVILALGKAPAPAEEGGAGTGRGLRA